jgi:hypothetical protein
MPARTRLQRLQHLAVLREGRQVPVLVHQPVLGLGARGRPSFSALNCRAAGQGPEGLVGAAHRHQPGVFDLLVAPELGQALARAGNSCSASSPTLYTSNRVPSKSTARGWGRFSMSPIYSILVRTLIAAKSIDS